MYQFLKFILFEKLVHLVGFTIENPFSYVLSDSMGQIVGAQYYK